jgi:hypothetical protein
MNHTPGPWIAEVHATLDDAKAVAGGFDWAEDWRWQSPPASVWLASEGGITGLPGCVETIAANAHLIAAAPDLLKALESIIKYEMTESTLHDALSAIAKAKGEIK